MTIFHVLKYPTPRWGSIFTSKDISHLPWDLRIKLEDELRQVRDAKSFGQLNSSVGRRALFDEYTKAYIRVVMEWEE